MPKLESTRHTAVKADTQKPGFYSFDGKPGLFLRVHNTGARCWMYRTRAGGVARWVKLGDATKMSLIEADAAAGVVRVEAKNARGKGAEENPIEKARAQKAAAAARKRKAAQEEAAKVTLDDLAKQYLGVYVAAKRREKGAKRWADYERAVYDREVSPRLGAYRIEDIRTRDVAAMRNAITSTSGKRKAVAVLRSLLSHAKSDGLVESNVAMGVKTDPSGERSRTLDRTECATLWGAQGLTKARPVIVTAVKVQLGTGQRAGEVLSMKWSDLRESGDTTIWTIPARVAKSGREHKIPLPKQVLALIEALRPPADEPEEERSEYVFKSWARKTRGKPIATSNYAHSVAAIAEELKLAPFGSHDLRRTCATRMAEEATLRVSPHTIAALLNHSAAGQLGITARYLKVDYYPELKKALSDWAKWLDRAVSDPDVSSKPASNVVPFPVGGAA